MIKLVALKKLRYPRGADGKERDIGEVFDALSERDAKALKLVRAAMDAPPDRKQPPAAVAPKGLEPQTTAPPTYATAAMSAEDAPADAPVETSAATSSSSRRYRRSDMRPEE